MNALRYIAIWLAAAAFGCDAGDMYNEKNALNDPFPSTYIPPTPTDALIINAEIYDGAGKRFDGASILFRNGVIESMGQDIVAPEGVIVIDANNRVVTPGIIDPHTHLGNAVPPYFAEEIEVWDVNEVSGPFAANMRAESALRTQDPAFSRLRAAGVTTIQILPGSANLFGGHTVVVRTMDAATVKDIKYPTARVGLKMSCGENPKNTYGEDGEFPTSRMGVVAGQREAFDKARRAARSGRRADPQIEPLADLLRHDLRAHIHCYTSDDMAIFLDIAREFDFQITAFHHAAEAYKIADRLAEADVCAIVWADWWGFKMEIYDAVRANAAILEEAGACVALHSDSNITGQRLPIEVAKAIAAGKRAGIEIMPENAIKWITSNPARILGIEMETGTLEPGKKADIVLWSGDPFSIYSHADLVFADGAIIYDRSDPTRDHASDFELGQPVLETQQ